MFKTIIPSEVPKRRIPGLLMHLHAPFVFPVAECRHTKSVRLYVSIFRICAVHTVLVHEKEDSIRYAGAAKVAFQIIHCHREAERIKYRL